MAKTTQRTSIIPLHKSRNVNFPKIAALLINLCDFFQGLQQVCGPFLLLRLLPSYCTATIISLWLTLPIDIFSGSSQRSDTDWKETHKLLWYNLGGKWGYVRGNASFASGVGRRRKEFSPFMAETVAGFIGCTEAFTTVCWPATARQGTTQAVRKEFTVNEKWYHLMKASWIRLKSTPEFFPLGWGKGLWC